MTKKTEIQDLEKHIERLRQRDLEVASIALGIQMRQRISQLEDENTLLKAALAETNLDRKKMLRSLSWIITRPLRVTGRKLKPSTASWLRKIFLRE
jgi:hypothetical protein